MPAADNAAIARRAYDAFNRRDLETAVADAAEGAEVVSLGLGRTFTGKEGARELLEFWVSVAHDGRVRILRQLAGEDGVTNEGIFEGSYTGAIPGPAGIIPAAGQPFTVPFAAVWRIANGQVVSIYGYFDRLDLIQQLTEPHAPS